MSSAKTVFLASIALVGALSYWLYREAQPSAGEVGEPLVVFCAEALRVPMEAIAREYREQTGRKVDLDFGASQAILTRLQLSSGDLFVPADDSYITVARQKDLVAETLPLARMHAVLLVRPGLEKAIAAWDDLLNPPRKLGLANPEAAAISKLAQAHLQKTGHWDTLLKLQPVFLGNVNELGNAVQLGTVDAGIVWDAVAGAFPKGSVVKLPELAGAVAQVQIAVTKSTRHPTQALHFARYVAARDRGLEHLRKHGFTVMEDADAWADAPELVVYAGAMLRPAIEETLKEFETREGVRLTTKYNGCGILVGEMKTGIRPDVYFACDVQFMRNVRELFGPSAVVANNQLVIAVRKGNPHNVQSLKDLGKDGLKVGVGHEQQCALGQLTKETFLATGLYGKVVKNVTVQSPTGDLLVVQLRGGALDAAVVYHSNVTPYPGDLDAIPVTGIPCATAQQPLAPGLATPYPQLTRRLVAALQTPQSRQRFEGLGFGWEKK